MRNLKFVAVLLVALLFTGCATYVDPGHVGVVVDNGGGGVQKNVLGPGWHSYMPGATRIIEYPVYMTTMSLARGDKDEADLSLNVTTMEGQPVNIDASLSFELDETKVPALYQTFRSDIDRIANG